MEYEQEHPEEPDRTLDITPIVMNAIAELTFLWTIREIVTQGDHENADPNLETLSASDLEGLKIQIDDSTLYSLAQRLPWEAPKPGDEAWPLVVESAEGGMRAAVESVCEIFGIDPQKATFDLKDLN